MNKWLFHQNGFTRTSLSATVVRVSNFVEENVCVCFFYIIKAPGPGGFSHSLPNTTGKICGSQCTQHVQSIE